MHKNPARSIPNNKPWFSFFEQFSFGFFSIPLSRLIDRDSHAVVTQQNAEIPMVMLNTLQPVFELMPCTFFSE